MRKHCKSGKVRFDKLGAMIALAGRQARDKGEVRCYPCPLCRSWHLTSQPYRPSAVAA